MNFTHYLKLGVAVQAIAISAFAHSADVYPARTIKLIVPFAPGATTDIVARVVAQGLSSEVGQPIIVENKPGASTILGTSFVAKSPADGYTLLLAVDSNMTINPLMNPNVNYIVGKDFKLIGEFGRMPIGLAVAGSSSYETVRSFVDDAKKNPGKINYGSTGAGALYHIVAEMFEAQTDVKLTQIPYRGGAPIMTALRSGEIQSAFNVVGTLLPQAKDEKIRILAITGEKRHPLLAKVPTFSEAGYPGFNPTSRFGLVGPAGMPSEVVEKLSGALNKVLRAPSFRTHLEGLGFNVPSATSPQEYESLIGEDAEKWGALVRARKITGDSAR